MKQLFLLVIISGLNIFCSCWGQGGEQNIPFTNREGSLLSDDKIKLVSVYNEPEHLKTILYGTGTAERDLAAERLTILHSGKANKIISQTLKSDNEEAIKSLLKALAIHKNDRFTEEIIGILENGKATLQPYVFAVFNNMDVGKISKIILKHLNQPEKPESVRQNLVRGLSFAPSKQSIPFLIGLLTNRKSDLNAEINNTLNILARQNFNTKEEWIKWWEVHQNQSREKWLEQAIIDYKREIQEKDNLIKQYVENISVLKVDVLKMRLEQARRLVDSTSEVNLLTNALNDKYITVKKYALEQVKTLEKDKIKLILPGLREELTAYKATSTESSVEDFRLMLVDILGDLGDEVSIEPLLGILNNPKESTALKNRVIIALRRIKNPKVVSPLLNLIDNCPVETVLVIVETFGAFGPDGRESVPKLHDYLKQSKYQNDEKLIKSIIDALGDIKDQSSTQEILPFIHDTRPRVRWSAVNCLGKIGVADVAIQLCKLLNDDVDIKQITIEVLGKLGNKTVCPEIIKMLNDKDPRTRQLSAEALGRIKDTTTLRSLFEVLNESDEKVTASAWAAILAITSDNLDLMEETATKLRELKSLNYAKLMLKKIIDLPQMQNNKDLESRKWTNESVLGLVLAELGESSEAIPYLSEAEKHFAGKLEFTYALIECYEKLQKYDLAIQSYSAILKDQKEESSEWWKFKIKQLSLYLLIKEYSKIIDETTKLLSKNTITDEIKEKLEMIKVESEKLLPGSNNQNTPSSNSK